MHIHCTVQIFVLYFNQLYTITHLSTDDIQKMKSSTKFTMATCTSCLSPPSSTEVQRAHDTTQDNWEHYCHKTFAHQIRPLKCKFCQRHFHDVDCFRRHQERELRKRYSGGNHHLRTGNTHVIRDHWHKCRVYKQRFARKGLKRHHDGSRTHKCSNRVQSVNIDNGHGAQSGEMAYYHNCKYCFKVFESTADLQKHVADHHICKYCGETFVKVSRLTHHISIRHHQTMVLNYQCKYCEAAFETKTDLLVHMAARHILHTCLQCGEKFGDLHALDIHIASRHTSVHRCGFCKKMFAKANNLQTHVKANHTCMLCGKTFDVDTLRNHVTTAHKFRCLAQDCKRTFVMVSDLYQHVNADHSDNTCEHCDVTFVDLRCLNIHIATKHMHKCGFCMNVFASANDLQTHVQADHSDRACEHCNLKFVDLSCLNIHITSKHMHKCGFCMKVFARANDLQTHVQADHTFPEAGHICSRCGKRMADLHSYRQHTCMELHISCKHCQRKFLTKTHLRQHLKDVHMCKYCGKEFANMEAHVISEHRCQVCDKEFVYKINIENHMMSHHS